MRVKITQLTGHQASVVDQFPGLVESTNTTATFDVEGDWFAEAGRAIDEAKRRLVQFHVERWGSAPRTVAVPHFHSVVRKVRRAVESANQHA